MCVCLELQVTSHNGEALIFICIQCFWLSYTLMLIWRRDDAVAVLHIRLDVTYLRPSKCGTGAAPTLPISYVPSQSYEYYCWHKSPKPRSSTRPVVLLGHCVPVSWCSDDYFWWILVMFRMCVFHNKSLVIDIRHYPLPLAVGLAMKNGKRFVFFPNLLIRHFPGWNSIYHSCSHDLSHLSISLPRSWLM